MKMHYRVRYLLTFDLKIRSGQVWPKVSKNQIFHANLIGMLRLMHSGQKNAKNVIKSMKIHQIFVKKNSSKECLYIAIDKRFIAVDAL